MFYTQLLPIHLQFRIYFRDYICTMSDRVFVVCDTLTIPRHLNQATKPHSSKSKVQTALRAKLSWPLMAHFLRLGYQYFLTVDFIDLSTARTHFTLKGYHQQSDNLFRHKESFTGASIQTSSWLPPANYNWSLSVFLLFLYNCSQIF